MDGLEVLKRIRAEERTRRVPVVILTSSSEDRDLIAGYDLGANGYVRKPIQFDQFATTVAQLGVYWLMINEPAPTADHDTEQYPSSAVGGHADGR
jgi:two-component system response regulator